MKTQQKDFAKTEGEAKTGGGREDVVGGREMNKRRTRAVQKGERSTVRTRTP